MNAISDGDSRAFRLVDIIDLKWLLAAEGIRVHVERLVGDPAYARELLALAGRSPNHDLRAAAARLQGLCPVTPPGP